MRAPLPTSMLLATLLSGCGTGLYDAAGVPPVDGAELTCVPGQVPCANTCITESVAHCGTCENDCSATSSPPARGQLACIASLCDFECLDGYLKCGSACCATTALAAGPASTCALLEDGSVRCWGANASGQLGDGSTTDRPAPVQVPLGGPAVAIGVGEGHACAVLASGTVTCWGANDAHQVSASSVSPILVPASTAVSDGAEVAAGAAHTCARTSAGAVRCWGSNASGQLGPGPGTPVSSGAQALAAGANHTCALVGGAVECWGDGASGQLGGTPTAGVATPIASGILLVAASSSQACASTGVSNGLGLDDVVRCWGSGLGSTFLPSDPQPTPAIPLKQPGQATIRFDVSLLAVGRAHVCVEQKTEAVQCFGSDNTLGQLGGTPAGPTESVAVPVPVTVPALVALAAGADHTCAALGDGRLRCWGASDRGQLGGDPSLNPIVTPSGR